MLFTGTAGTPARNEREARKVFYYGQFFLRKTSRLRRVAGGAPAVPADHIRD